jgi:CheY-like chemotaxis protein
VGKGTGLGLSMVYGFMKQSNGHVSVYSEVGHGTVFRLFLPVASATASTALPSNAAQKISIPDAVILAVDDNPEVRATVVAQLQGLGYVVREADSAHTAWGILDSGERIDLLFTDIVMPGGLNGKELATKARARHPDLKVLFTSGFPGASTGPGVSLGDGDVLLSKPYRKDDLARAVAKVLAAVRP